MDPADYSARFEKQHNWEVRERVLKQIHAKSQVLNAKLRHVRAGLKLLAGALAFWACARVILVIGFGRLL